jgi:hypothetical protein
MPDCCVILAAEDAAATVASFDERLAQTAKTRNLPVVRIAKRCKSCCSRSTSAQSRHAAIGSAGHFGLPRLPVTFGGAGLPPPPGTQTPDAAAELAGR